MSRNEYDLEKDHEAIKKQIKKWELEIDALVARYRKANQGNQFEPLVIQIGNELEGITEEMMSINI